VQHSTGAMTKAEKDRITRILGLGCVACAHLGIPNGRHIQVHHLIQGNRRLGHTFTIPLCEQHHTGYNWQELWGIIPNEMQVSLADGRKAWVKCYPTEKELWERVQDRLHLAKEWPESKVLPRMKGCL
jgi:hypothetical protein